MWNILSLSLLPDSLLYDLVFCVFYGINHHHPHHHVVPLAWISLTLSRHFSLSFIASGRSSGLHPVSSHSLCMYVRAGRPLFARPYVWVHGSTSLMSSSLLLQQCPVCLVRLTWIVFVMEGRWPYIWCLVVYCLLDLFKIARNIIFDYFSGLLDQIFFLGSFYAYFGEVIFYYFSELLDQFFFLDHFMLILGSLFLIIFLGYLMNFFFLDIKFIQCYIHFGGGIIFYYLGGGTLWLFFRLFLGNFMVIFLVLF